MATHRTWCVFAVAVLVLSPVLTLSAAASAQDAPSNALAYHQITKRTKGLNSLGTPVISGDGNFAAYAESGGQALDPEHPNRIFRIETASGEVKEVDSYEALCFCQSWVDTNYDGYVIASTDTVQIRSYLYSASPLLKLDSNEISGFKVTRDGSDIFFTLRRDATMDKGKKTLKRGVYSIPINGGTPKLIVGAEAIAAAVNVPMSKMPNVLHYDFNPNLLDVSDDGDLVAFGAFAGAGEYLLTVPGGGGAPEVIAGPYPVMTHAAISGDGATLAWGMTRGDSYDVGVLRNGKPSELLEIYNETYQPLQLSTDGKWLLIGTDGSLYDTDTLISRPLATPDFSSRPSSLVKMGVDRMTMSNDARTFLYVFLQPHLSAFEQLSTLILDPKTGGDEPFVRDARLYQSEISIQGAVRVKAVVGLSWNGELTSVGMVAIHLGQVDPNVAGGERFVDSKGEDPMRGEGIFMCDGLYYTVQVVRDDDTGPRTVRVYAEVKSDTGLYHATAIDFATLNVIASQ